MAISFKSDPWGMFVTNPPTTKLLVIEYMPCPPAGHGVPASQVSLCYYPQPSETDTMDNNLGALENTAWEASIPRNEICSVGEGSDPSEPCGQGRIPLYSARVQSTEDIQAAVRFANDKNLRLAIKNTGHDAGGRSSAVDSFQILTQGLKEITFTDDFVPWTALANAPSEGPAVTFGAGVLGMDLYAAAAERGYNVVAGECSTIGVAGGYIQGGGVSTVLAPLRGLSADLVLQVEIVTADVGCVVRHVGMVAYPG